MVWGDEVEKLSAVRFVEVLGVELDFEDVRLVVVQQKLLRDAILDFGVHFASLKRVAFWGNEGDLQELVPPESYVLNNSQGVVPDVLDCLHYSSQELLAWNLILSFPHPDLFLRGYLPEVADRIFSQSYELHNLRDLRLILYLLVQL